MIPKLSYSDSPALTRKYLPTPTKIWNSNSSTIAQFADINIVWNPIKLRPLPNYTSVEQRGLDEVNFSQFSENKYTHIPQAPKRII